LDLAKDVRIREITEQMQKEKDPHKLMLLAQELIRLLDEGFPQRPKPEE